MKHFRTSFSEVICGTINIPASIRIGLISDSKNVDYPLIHNRSVNLSSGLSFKTASSEITQDIIPDKYVIYCDQESGICGPWIVQNAIEVKVYETKNNTLLARKIIGSLDDISIMPSNDVYEHPSIVLEPCSSSPVNLKNSFIRIEFKSLCDSGSEACCDHLPNNVSVSGYDVLCLPLDEFHVVPTHPPTTTTPAPVIENRTIIDRQPTIKTSDDIDYYRVESDISIIGGSSFKYWWERKEDESGSWVRHTELQEAPSNTTVFIREPKERDYYYRLLLIEPNQMYSDSVFFDFPDPTTTTTTTLAPPFFEPPDKVTNVEGSGAFRGVHLSWTPPAYDGNSDITGYHIIGKLPDDTKFPFQETTVVDTGVLSSVSGYFQPIPFQYDGVDILYCVYSMNYFGIKGAQDGGSSCVIASSKSNDPPTVFNLEITPFRTSSTRGYNLDWDVSSAPDLPLLSHIIKYRPSGSTEVHTTGDYSELASNASITGDFLGCEMYEINVQGVNEIGESVAVTGYSLMNFPASAPTGISYTLLEGDSNEFVEMSGSWSAPADDGLCPIGDYVFSYRLLPDGDFTDAINTNNGLTFKTSDTLPSGDYELRVAAITEFEVIHRTVEGVPVVVDSIYTTGVYGMYNPLTIFIYNFESWRVINETPISQNPNGDYTLNSTYPYFPSGNIITEDIGPRNIPATLICGNQGYSDDEGIPYDCYDGFETSKFGNYGLYLSENNFACPVDNYNVIEEYDDQGNQIAEEYINGWKYLMGPEINNIIKSEGGIVSDPIPLHKDEKSKLTFEFWFKLSGSYQSSWEEYPVYVADIVFAHTRDVADLSDGDAFRSSNGYDYVYDGSSDHSNDYAIFNSDDTYYELCV